MARHQAPPAPRHRPRRAQAVLPLGQPGRDHGHRLHEAAAATRERRHPRRRVPLLRAVARGVRRGVRVLAGHGALPVRGGPGVPQVRHRRRAGQALGQARRVPPRPHAHVRQGARHGRGRRVGPPPPRHRARLLRHQPQRHDRADGGDDREDARRVERGGGVGPQRGRRGAGRGAERGRDHRQGELRRRRRRAGVPEAAGHAGAALPVQPPGGRAARQAAARAQHLRGVEARAGDRRAAPRHHRVAPAPAGNDGQPRRGPAVAAAGRERSEADDAGAGGRVQDLLLRRARDHGAGAVVDAAAAGGAPGVAGRAAGGGPGGAGRRRAGGGRRRAGAPHQDGVGHERGAAAVPAVAERAAAGAAGRGDGGRTGRHPAGHQHVGGRGGHAPRRRAVGRRRARLPPGPLRQGPAARRLPPPHGLPALRLRRPRLRRPQPHGHGVPRRARHAAAPLPAGRGARVPPRAQGHALAQAVQRHPATTHAAPPIGRSPRMNLVRATSYATYLLRHNSCAIFVRPDRHIYIYSLRFLIVDIVDFLSYI